MTLKSPLVLYFGNVSELTAGDSLSTPVDGIIGGNSPNKGYFTELSISGADARAMVNIGASTKIVSGIEYFRTGGAFPVTATAYVIPFHSETTAPASATTFAELTSFKSQPATTGANSVVSVLNHYAAAGASVGAGASIANQYGFRAVFPVPGATNNIGFYSEIVAGTGDYNFYAAGTADNYFAGKVGIGSVPLSYTTLYIAKNITGAADSFSIFNQSLVLSDVTSSVNNYYSAAFTQAATFTLGAYTHYRAEQGTIGIGSAITNQFGFRVGNTLIGATNNYGFHSEIAAGTGRYNFYAAGTAQNLFSGGVLVFGAGGLGYTTGSGGTVTQATSRTTGVTLNKTNGAITLVSVAGSTSYQSFTVTNSMISATDTIIINQKSGTDKYIVLITAVAAGSFTITFATTGGTTTEQPVFNFSVIKATTA